MASTDKHSLSSKVVLMAPTLKSQFMARGLLAPQIHILIDQRDAQRTSRTLRRGSPLPGRRPCSLNTFSTLGKKHKQRKCQKVMSTSAKGTPTEKWNHALVDDFLQPTAVLSIIPAIICWKCQYHGYLPGIMGVQAWMTPTISMYCGRTLTIEKQIGKQHDHQDLALQLGCCNGTVVAL